MTCVSSITVSPSCKTLGVGETCYLTAVVCPTNATCKCVKWSSSNSNVATVTSSGFVKAQKTGTVTITATATDGSNVKDTMTLKVSPVSVRSVTLNRSQLTVNKGSSYCLTATVCPSNASNSSLSWCSSNTNVATVINGRVTGVGKGTATITAMAMDGSGKSDTCEVKVKVPVSSISVSSYCNPMNVGDVCSLSASVYPYDADNRGVCWTSSKTNVVTVTSGGIVTAKSPGTATITATATDGSGTHGCTEITVNKVGVTCLRLSKNQLSMDKNTGIELTAWVGPDNATNKSVRWSSSNSRVAEVNNGCVTANDGGTATITATSDDNSKCFDTCEINVKVPVESITIYYQALLPDALDAQLYVGESQLYEALVLPANATNKCIHWESSNTSVATVTSGGIVTARKAGTATIMAKATDGSGVVGQLCLNIHDPILIKSITLNKTCISVQRGKTYQLTADICPINATYKQVKWCSTNEQVAKVSASGVVTAKSSGSATIYCSALDGSGVCTACEVEVVVLVESITFEPKRGMIWLNSKKYTNVYQLRPIVCPSDATNQTITYCSSDPGIARVDPQSGLITAISPGLATITATARDGSGVQGNFISHSEDARPKALCVRPTEAKIEIDPNRPGSRFAFISANFEPNYTDENEVIWDSNNNVVSMKPYRSAQDDSMVSVEGLKYGTAVITARQKNGQLSGSCKVTVCEKVPEAIDTRKVATFKMGKGPDGKTSSESYHVTFEAEDIINSYGEVVGKTPERVWDSLGSFLVYEWTDNVRNINIDQIYNHYVKERHEENRSVFIDSVTTPEEMKIVISQLAYLYRYDPIGIEYFVGLHAEDMGRIYYANRDENNDYQDDDDRPIRDSLDFKDALFKEIFRKDPEWYLPDNPKIKFLTNDGGKTYGYNGHYYLRKDIYSQAEALFGYHVILDLEKFLKNLVKSFVDFALGMIGINESKKVEIVAGSIQKTFDIAHEVQFASSFGEIASSELSGEGQDLVENLLAAGLTAAEPYKRVLTVGKLILDICRSFESLFTQPDLTEIPKLDRLIYSSAKELKYRGCFYVNGKKQYLDESDGE